MKKNLSYYRSLPYHLEVDRFEDPEDEELYFRAYYEEIPQVQGVHQDPTVAKQLAKELFDSYIEAQLAWGEEIPEPATPRFRKPGGRWMFKSYELVRSGGTAASMAVRSETDAESSKTGSDAGEVAMAG